VSVDVRKKGGPRFERPPDKRGTIAQERRVRRLRRKAEHRIAVRSRHNQRHAWRFGKGIPGLIREARQIPALKELRMGQRRREKEIGVDFAPNGVSETVSVADE